MWGGFQTIYAWVSPLLLHPLEKSEVEEAEDARLSCQWLPQALLGQLCPHWAPLGKGFIRHPNAVGTLPAECSDHCGTLRNPERMRAGPHSRRRSSHAELGEARL